MAETTLSDLAPSSCTKRLTTESDALDAAVTCRQFAYPVSADPPRATTRPPSTAAAISSPAPVFDVRLRLLLLLVATDSVSQQLSKSGLEMSGNGSSVLDGRRSSVCAESTSGIFGVSRSNMASLRAIDVGN